MSTEENCELNISDFSDNPTSTSAHEGCVFCRILQGSSPGNVLFSDDEVFCIRDIRPASTNHILVLPKKHLPNASLLTRDQLPLVSHMEKVGLQVVENQGGSVAPNDVIMGFHWPPFSSQSHLHLHAISPKRRMGWVGKLIFWPGTYWFVTSLWLLNRLENS